MPTNKFETTFPSEMYRVKQTVSKILHFVEESTPKATDDDIFEIRLVFMELLCNAVIHGNKHDTHKNVHICIEISHNILNAKIVDEGPGFDHMNLIKGINNYSEEEHGRGIRLAYSLTDSLAFNTIGNEINFYKRVAANEQNTGS